MKRTKRSKPETVRIGNCMVRIYKRQRPTATGKARTVYEVSDYSGGHRQLRGFTEHGDARREAEQIARRLANGEATAATIRNKDAASYGRSVELVRPTGASLEVAAATYAKVYELIGDRHIEAAQFFKRHGAGQLTRKHVAEVVVELLAAKEARNKSERYISDLRSRLTRFAKFFGADVSTITEPNKPDETGQDRRNRGVEVHTITTPEVQRWLDGLTAAPQTAKNFRTVLFGLFSFAESRGYIFKGGNPVEDTESIKTNGGDVEIYAPAEIEKLLAAADGKFLPCLAIGAFAGLRAAEIERLEWRDVHLEEKFIVVGADKSKTATRRVVPIADNLAAWLADYGERSGKVWDGSSIGFYKTQEATAKAAGVEWRHNGLRHSFASYRLAQIQNGAQVALECGNSPKVVFRHYRELVTAGLAAEWFAITPPTIQPSDP